MGCQMTFRIGDVVHLKSGGPEMVVLSGENSSAPVQCIWHNNTGCIDSAEIPPAALVLANPPEKPDGWVSFAERGPTRLDANEDGVVLLCACDEHQDCARVELYLWDSFDESLDCPRCYWMPIPRRPE